MSIAKITLIGMYNYDNTLFAGIVVDPGETLIPATIVTQILAKCGEFETLYSDLDFMRFMIGAWWIRWKHTFYRWSRALDVDYAPLENYDRQESFSRSHTGTEDTTLDITGSSTEAASGSEHHAIDDTINRYRSAYDETTNPALTDREVADKDDQVTRSESVNTSGLSRQVTDKDVGFTETETNRVHGNIGVTTSQQMLESELDLYRNFQLYDQIADAFKMELCVFVYS